MKKFQLNYGFIVIDPKQKGYGYDVLHFCGYEKKPTKEDREK